jgi:outer membrane lipoprotein-sorting protein
LLLTKGRPQWAALFLCPREVLVARAMRCLLAALLLTLAGCRDQGPAAPTAEQADQLNEAENMLNGVAANEEGPADRSTGPSNSSD